MGAPRKLRFVKWLLLLAVLAAGIGYGGWYLNPPPESVVKFQTVAVTRGQLLQVVTSSGQLNPVTMVDVGSQISGIIQQLLVDFNSTVTKGQVIARIDPATYEANSLEAEGDLISAQAALELAQLAERRAKLLRGDKLNTQAEYENAVASLHQAEANVKIKEGALKSARVSLERCTIYSPIDGLVLSRNVNVGQTVAASFSAPTLFVIANDLTKMQIEANVVEADIGLVQVGQEAEFTVDAFPGETFHGKVRQIRNAPKADQNVITYATIIEVGNPELKLKPGMTANVSVIVARREDALKVPNAALRFRPSDRLVLKQPALPAKTNTTANLGSDSAARVHKKDQKKGERAVYMLAGQSPGAASNSAQSVSLQSVPVKTGINNATFTEVVQGLKEGDEVVTGVASSKGRSERGFNPFAVNSRR